jgi:predicted permease
MPSPRRDRPFWHLRRRPHQIDAEIDEELDVHLEMRVQELKGQGMPPDAARREALRQFGDLDYTRQYCRHQDLGKETRMQRMLVLGDLRQDIRICLRSLWRVPLMTLTIVATVGLGIGATTVIFGAVEAALLRPLPYADPDRLVRIYTDAPPNVFRFSLADYFALHAQQTQFEHIAAFTDRAMAYSDGNSAERLRGREVSSAYFAVLGIRPALGRDFVEADTRPGNPLTLIASHGFWQRRLAGRTDVIGRPLRLDGRDYALIGILPQQTGPLERLQEYFIAAQWEQPKRRGPFLYTVIGRLRDGSSHTAVTSELRAINRRIFPLWQASYQDDRATWSLTDLKTFVTGDVTAVAALAAGAVALVWLIACANASNLLIARVASRRRELAIRAALGASRGRVIQYLLMESSILAVAAAVVGVIIAMFGMGLLRDFGATYFPRTQEIALDGPVLGLLVALTIGSAAIFGLIPAVHGAGGSINKSLHATGKSATANRAVTRLRRVLVGSQFAIATPLLVIAALLSASLTKLSSVDIGFDGQNVLTGSISLPASTYNEPARVTVFWDELRRKLQAAPGVSAVAFADGRPPNDVGNFNNFDLEEFPTPSGQSQPVTPWVSVSPEYFQLLGLTLIEGRVFDEFDAGRAGVPVVVVDQDWQRRFFPNASAVGKRFRQGGCTDCPWTTVIGVVSDVDYNGVNQADEGAVYWPMGASARTRNVLLRTEIDPRTLIPSLQQAVRELDPALPLSSVATIDDLIGRSLERPRSLSLLVVGVALVALILSIVSIYGVMAYHVQQQLKEISIRLALGASRRNVFGLIVGQGMVVVGCGIVVGLIAALLASRLMSRLLFGITATDATTFVGVTLFLLTMALLACLVPSRRAIGLQPAAVLRTE